METEPELATVVAVFSDVHSNHLALGQVLADARCQGADEVWFLGDLVGYGPFPAQVWSLVQQQRPPWRWAVAGNQDWGLIGRLGKSFGLSPQPSSGRTATPVSLDFNEIAHRAQSMNQAATPERGAGARLRAWLGNLPLVASPRAGVYLVHGSFAAERRETYLEAYVCDADDAEAAWGSLLQQLGNTGWSAPGFVAEPDRWHPPRLLLVGHWHTQLAWRRAPNGPHSAVWQRLVTGFGAPPYANCGHATQPAQALSSAEPVPVEVVCRSPLLDSDLRCPAIVNPGSVGLPRDGAQAAAGWAWAKYALIDWGQPGGQLRFRYVPYRIQPVLDELEKLAYPKEIADWLRG